MVGETGFEPATPWSLIASVGLSPTHTDSDPISNNAKLLASGAPSVCTGSQPEHPFSRSLSHPCPMDSTPGRLRKPVPQSLLSVAKVAQLLGVCRATAYRMIESGELPHVRVVNAIRVDRRDLQRWLGAAKTKGARAR
jgi:excisionase family DNA binding protein